MSSIFFTVFLMTIILPSTLLANALPLNTVETTTTNDNVKRTSQTFDTNNVEKGSDIVSVDVSFTLDNFIGKKCALFLNEKHLNKDRISDIFICEINNTVPLEIKGVDAFQTKLGDNFNIQIKNIDDDSTLAVQSDSINLSINYITPTYYAKVENNIVTNMIVSDSDFIKSYDGHWVKVEKENYIGIGYSYVNGLFVPPQPFPSWTLNGVIWEAPTPYPDGFYLWNEDKQSWVLVD